jgi:hypothetical protein
MSSCGGTQGLDTFCFAEDTLDVEGLACAMGQRLAVVHRFTAVFAIIDLVAVYVKRIEERMTRGRQFISGEKGVLPLRIKQQRNGDVRRSRFGL